MNKKTVTVFATALGLVTLLVLLFVRSERKSAHSHSLENVCSVCSSTNCDQLHILDKVKKIVQQEIDKKEVNDVAVYFRDLKTGTWCSINKDKKFNLASLIKVPLMIECLETVESKPDLLKKHLLFTGDKDWTAQQNLKPKVSLQPGRTYTLEETMFRMIAYSDNNAMSMVLNEFPAERLDRFFTSYNFDFEKAQDGYKMSIGTFSEFFEILYDHSLLNRSMSDKALSFLASEDFPQGMHAAVPGNVKIEGKFGEKVSIDESGMGKKVQLHEIGIVRSGDHPFLLGIMTSGKDVNELEKVIKDVTSNVYEENEQLTNFNRTTMDCMARCHVNNSGV